jgi:hypothetical protein
MAELEALRGQVVRLLSNSGHIVGFDEPKSDDSETEWLWKHGERFDLGSKVTAMAINDRGQVVGFEGPYGAGRVVLWTVPQ